MRSRPLAGPQPSRRLLLRLALCGALALLLGPSGAQAHEQDHAIAGRKLQIKANGDPSKRKVSFSARNQISIGLAHNPATEGMSVLVVGTGANGGRTELIVLDPSLWKTLGKASAPKGYRYQDSLGSRGGITKLLLKSGKLRISARGPNWSWSPGGVQDEVWVYFRIEQETYCARFGGSVKRNEAGLFQSKDADSPGDCPDQVCGNGRLELGEDCDDGNLVEDDGCNNNCTSGVCSGQTFASTFEGIQSIVFDGYGCTSILCHDDVSPQGSLSLSDANTSFNTTVGVPAFASLFDRVEPGDQDLSFLYNKLAAATLGTPTGGGGPMPIGGALTLDHLEAVKLWIRGGAPRDLVVEGTASLLGTCLPEPNPLTIPVPDPPGTSVGVQFQQTPWDLPAQFEDEICMATYYDLTGPGLVPAWAKFPCPSVFMTPSNPSGECFRYHKLTHYQDPQSHHSIIHIYAGGEGPAHSGWGSYTYKFQDPNDPLNGSACVPTDIDPNTGYNPGCSGSVQTSFACIGYGPPDYDQTTAPTFSGSQEPLLKQEYADGVYSILPMSGIIVWNSHAFNLTTADSTLSQYLNMDFADPNDQLYLLQGVFDAASIFVQNVPPFETREYCRTYTIPQGAHLFNLGSHTHRHGIQWR
ncbi:MAG: hypothetical protein V3T24_07555, partial [Longimicrobiales bacterium]